jgi:hypothetical protein
MYKRPSPRAALIAEKCMSNATVPIAQALSDMDRHMGVRVGLKGSALHLDAWMCSKQHLSSRGDWIRCLRLSQAPFGAAPSRKRHDATLRSCAG